MNCEHSWNAVNVGVSMKKFVYVATVEELSGDRRKCGIDELSPGDFVAHKPDRHLILYDRSQIRARCSLWWRSVPHSAGARIGCIGHYAAIDDADAKELLVEACSILKEHGVSVAIGPMDGNPLRRYRLITRRGTDPPFFLEPDNPDAYPVQFASADFTPLTRYYSSLNDDLGTIAGSPDDQLLRLKDDGIYIRNIDDRASTGDLSKIFDIFMAGSGNNYLCSESSRGEFIDACASVQPFARLELMLIAEREGKPLGFIFALPDMLRVQRGQPADTVILKSMAVLPELSGRGIGECLVKEVSKNARQLGFRRAIHAFVHEDARSGSMSCRYGREIREYMLYSRNLS
jgi:GNAT superfamily N-acetyltransferase